MTFGSLFAGIGGFDLGLERAGFRCVDQVERDKPAASVLAAHWPDTPRHTDVCDYGSAATDARPDLLCGGFPCQDLSVAGKRAGLAGERSGLWYEFARVIGELAPRWVLVENVPGLLSSRGGRDLGAVLGTLAVLGYGFAYRVLDAQWFGLAQRRRRLFVVGCAGADWRRAARVLFEPESLPWNPPPRREARAYVAYCVAAGAGGSKFGSGRDGEDTLIPFETDQLTSRHNRSNPQAGDPAPTMASRAQPPAVAYRNTGNDGCFETGDRVGSLNTGTDRNQHVIAYQCHGSNVGPMATLRVGNGNECGGVPFTIAERWEVRRLTPRECERLQGFPDDWTAGNPPTARYRMLGNAVPPPVAEWIGRRILAADTPAAE